MHQRHAAQFPNLNVFSVDEIFGRHNESGCLQEKKGVPCSSRSFKLEILPKAIHHRVLRERAFADWKTATHALLNESKSERASGQKQLRAH